MIDLALLVLRVVIGAIFVAHGAQKLFGSFGGPGLKGTTGFFDQLGIRPAGAMALAAGLTEFVGGILLAVGFLTPVAALSLVVVMAVAAITVHIGNGFFATEGGYEYNLALGAVALAFVIAGAGAYSVDAAIGFLW